jgi:glyoxylase-like metal-dependent hydrolase (beta-lactamase superfamily II)
MRIKSCFASAVVATMMAASAAAQSHLELKVHHGQG